MKLSRSINRKQHVCESSKWSAPWKNSCQCRTCSPVKLALPIYCAKSLFVLIEFKLLPDHSVSNREPFVETPWRYSKLLSDLQPAEPCSVCRSAMLRVSPWLALVTSDRCVLSLSLCCIDQSDTKSVCSPMRCSLWHKKKCTTWL